MSKVASKNGGFVSQNGMFVAPSFYTRAIGPHFPLSFPISKNCANHTPSKDPCPARNIRERYTRHFPPCAAAFQWESRYGNALVPLPSSILKLVPTRV